MSIESQTELVPPTDPATIYQIECFTMGLKAIMAGTAQMAVMPVVEKATGKEENMIVLMQETEEGMRVLPIALLPKGKQLALDYAATNSKGERMTGQARVGRWHPEDTGKDIDNGTRVQ